MKCPKTYEELLKLVNPTDLLEVLDFSGVNDNRDKEHSKIKGEFSNIVYNSIKDTPKNPSNQFIKLSDKHYNTIIKCIQDFYYWGHRFNHIYGHIYKRVCNALNISKKEIEKIYNEKMESKQ